jgi:uncharacterized protein (UPF0218 family)
MLVLPEKLRYLLKEPFGQLVNETKLINILKNEDYIISIGDMVTYTILKNNIKPIMCIVDFKTKRGMIKEEIKNVIRSFGTDSIIVKNSPGTISDELWNAIETSFIDFESKNLRIEVDGEEDLASLAAIYMAPPDVTIIYGLPDKGVLIVKPTYEIKNKVKKILDKM